jgi:hypothetical protein
VTAPERQEVIIMGKKALVPLTMAGLALTLLAAPTAQPSSRVVIQQATQIFDHHENDPRECFQKDTPECNSRRAEWDRSRDPDDDGD